MDFKKTTAKNCVPLPTGYIPSTHFHPSQLPRSFPLTQTLTLPFTASKCFLSFFFALPHILRLCRGGRRGRQLRSRSCCCCAAAHSSLGGGGLRSRPRNGRHSLRGRGGPLNSLGCRRFGLRGCGGWLRCSGWPRGSCCRRCSGRGRRGTEYGLRSGSGCRIPEQRQ